MSDIRPENLSAFARLAIQLDVDFSELNRVSGQIQRLDIESDSGLDRAVKLLNQFAAHGQSITDNIQNFSKALQEAQSQSESAAKAVADRAQLIQQRKQQQNAIKGKLAQIEDQVKAANAHLLGFRREGKTNFTDQEKIQLKATLEELNRDMKKIAADAQVIEEEASQSNFKNIEREAKALLNALRESSRKVEKII